MSAGTKPRFDSGALRDVAGAKVFARGEEYHRGGLVTLLSIEPQRVLAHVAGTEDYRVELTGRGRKISGTCSCRAFHDWGFCKHLVASALAVNEAGGGTRDDAAGALPRIRAHLAAKGVDALVAMILDLAEQDLALFQKLDMAAAMQGDARTLEARLGTALDKATRATGHGGYRDAATWANGVDEVLDAVADLVAGGRADMALRLAERAIEQIELAIETIDDSDENSIDMLARARDIHLDACRAIRPDPVALARSLYARAMSDAYDTFADAVSLYADVLGEEGLREYRRLAAEAWAKLPPVTGRQRGGTEGSGERQLVAILDYFAERDGDIAARIALRARNLSTPWAYLQLAELCRAHGREKQALTWAEEGLWVFEDDRVDARLLDLAVAMLLQAGRAADAQAHLWRAFTQAPNLELYAGLRRLGGGAARDSALAHLESLVQREPRSRWHFPADLLVGVLMQEAMFDTAWLAVHKHGASMAVREKLARASEATHPHEALAVYAERVDRLADAGGNNAYGEAVHLIGRMAQLRGAADQVAYVAAIRQRFGRKRNFMKLLG